MIKYCRVLSIILGLMLSNSTFAYDFEINGFNYNITSPTTATLEQIDSVTAEVIIPATVTFEGHELTVTALGSGLIPYSEKLVIRKAVLPETIETIGYGAFLYCESLQYVNLPKNLQIIESEAFSQCHQLVIDEWPDQLRKIGNDAFVACDSLTSVHLPGTMESIGMWAFNYSGITSLRIDRGGPVALGDYSFINCKRLKEVTFDADVNGAIGQQMFYQCESLESAVFNGSITPVYGSSYMGGEAFRGCVSLKTVRLPKGLTNINSGAFAECQSLESIDLGDQLTDLNLEAFANSGLRSITLPETLTNIGPIVFWGCKNLESITLPLRVERICGYFDSTSGITRMEVKNRVPLGINEYEWIDLYNRITLVVPAGSKDLYAQHDIWGRFEKIEEAAPERFTYYADFNIKGEGRLLWNGKPCVSGDRIELTEGDTIQIRQEPVNESDSVVWVYMGNDENVKLHRDSVYTFVVTKDINLSVFFRTRVIVEQVQVTLKQTELGVVKLDLTKGKRAEIKIQPDDGWKVNCISQDGIDVTSRLTDTGFLVTEPLQEDTEIVIAFERTGSDNIEQRESAPFRVRAFNGTLMIDNVTPNSLIDIYRTDGSLVKQLHAKQSSLSIQLPIHQIYLIKIANNIVKIRL